MNVSNAAISILNQLTDLVHQIREPDFRKSSPTLSGATIGQHVRHTLEFFLCFEAGYHGGLINYDKRSHDKCMEANKDVALTTLSRVIAFVSNLRQNKALTIEVGYDPYKEKTEAVETNTLRELVYNIEHAVHHMAIIKIGVRELAPYVTLAPDFGIAASTLRYINRAMGAISNS